MKNLSRILILGLFLFSTSCTEEFLDVPVEDAITADNFYKTDSQVLSGSAFLYGRPWFYYNDKFRWAMGDSFAGNSVGSFQALAQFVNFSMGPSNQFMIEGWESYWVVVTQANFLLEAIENNLGEEVSDDARDRAIGEALFMRSLAYFHMVRLWGEIPILDKVTIDTSEPLRRNTIESIYRFIREGFEQSAELIPAVGTASDGRIGKVAPWSYLAKMHLTLEDYPNARLYAEKVIGSGEHFLVPDMYESIDSNIFVNPSLNNGPESIFALQWVSCVDWGVQNTNQAYFAADGNITKAGDGWGTCQPSIELINSFEANDKRRYWTLMEPNNFYPELDTTNEGYTVAPNGMTSTIAGIRKYVIGSPDEWPGDVCFMRTEMNTHMMRYAEVLLIQAEAILAGAASTSDAIALEAYNAIRRRAGLDEKTSITLDDILQERKIELAGEAKYWFDLQRIDRTKAKQIIMDQERGTNLNGDPTQIVANPIEVTDSDFLFPFPDGDRSFVDFDSPAVDFYAN